MSRFDFESDPRLPDNVLIVTDTKTDAWWMLEFGKRPDGEDGATVTDMEPEYDDDTVTQLEYVFVNKGPVYAHVHTGLHRHGSDGNPNGGEGECEQAPPDEQPAPDPVLEIVMDAFDAPVATPGNNVEVEE